MAGDPIDPVIGQAGIVMANYEKRDAIGGGAHDNLAQNRCTPKLREPVPAVVDEHASVDQRHAGDSIRVAGRPGHGDRTAEVVGDQMHALNPQLVDQAAQVRGISRERVVPDGAHVGPAEAGQVGREHGGELGHPGHQRLPVAAGIGIAVHEYHGLARRTRADQDR